VDARILLIGADPELDLALSSAGYAVTVVGTLDEARELGWPPAVVMLNLSPFDDGPALCTAALRRWPRTRLIVLTRDPDPLAAQALRYAGADACLVEPMDRARLVAEVGRLVGPPPP
jgi:DNA-binding response OmpR family regulator